MVAAEWRQFRGIEEVPCIEPGVADKLVGVAMESVAARLGDRVQDGPRGLAVSGRIVRQLDGKLLNRVDAEVQPEDTARGGIGVVVDADTIHSVVVFKRPVPIGGQLVPQPAIGAIGSAGGRRLGPDAVGTGLQRRQQSPVATVQRQFTHRYGIDLRVHGPRGEIHLRSRRSHFNSLRGGAYLQGNIEEVRLSNGQDNVVLPHRGESGRRERDVIRSGRQIGRRICAGAIGGQVPGKARGRVLNDDLRVRNDCPSWVAHGSRQRCTGYLSVYRRRDNRTQN